MNARPRHPTIIPTPIIRHSHENTLRQVPPPHPEGCGIPHRDAPFTPVPSPTLTSFVIPAKAGIQGWGLWSDFAVTPQIP